VVPPHWFGSSLSYEKLRLAQPVALQVRGSLIGHDLRLPRLSVARAAELREKRHEAVRDTGEAWI
jgi:hypothetical protein